LLPGHRELLAPPDRPRARRTAANAVRLPAGRRAAGRRRIARDRAAARRDVQGRPFAQGDAGRVRLPPALRARQPAAEVRRIRTPGAALDLRLGDTVTLRARTFRRKYRRTRRAPDWPRRPRSRNPPSAHASRRPA